MRRSGRSVRIWAIVAMACVMVGWGWREARAQEGAPEEQGERGGLPAGSQMVRGTVTASSPEGLTLKTAAGELYKVTVTPNTRLIKARQPVKLAEIKAGDGAGAMGVLDPATKTLHAMFVSVLDAEQVKKAQADLGKTYILGRVTAIDEVKLTIKRPDGVVQVIQVDEGTSFRRGGRGMGAMAGEGGDGAGGGSGQRSARQGTGASGESITLADIKVGDSVGGRGALKGGVFVPTELGVIDPGARRRRGGSGSGEAAGAATPTAGVPQ